jgi:hypothetical protein
MNIETLKHSNIRTPQHKNVVTQQRNLEPSDAVTTFMVGRLVVGIFAVIAFPECRFHMLLNNPG